MWAKQMKKVDEWWEHRTLYVGDTPKGSTGREKGSWGSRLAQKADVRAISNKLIPAV